MVKQLAYLIVVAMLGVAAPAAAQTGLTAIDPAKVRGAVIEQADRIDRRDLIADGNGGFRPKPNARLAREARSCELDARQAQAVARALVSARAAPEAWDSMGVDMRIRFEGIDGDEGPLAVEFNGYLNPGGHMRLYFDGVPALLNLESQAIVARVAEAAGCAFTSVTGG